MSRETSEVKVHFEPVWEHNVGDHVYKKVELIGSSKSSVTEAIETAIARAAKTIKNLEWFEVDQIRGHIKDGAVAHYQVTMKVGFRIDD
jgi:flavin-binding protein dodecin